MLGLVFTLLECTFVVDLNCVYVFYETNYRSSPIWSFAITHTRCASSTRDRDARFFPLSPHPTPPRLFPTAYSARYAGEWKKKTYVTVRLTQYHFYTSSTAFLYVLLPNYRLQLFFLPQIPNGFSIEPISIWEESQLRQILLSHDAFGHLTDQPTD